MHISISSKGNLCRALKRSFYSSNTFITSPKRLQADEQNCAPLNEKE